GAGLLPETADTSTLAVQHLTDGKAETVADAGAVTAGDVTVKNEAVKADFEVKSFSTFTITWSVNNGRDFVEKFKFTVKYVDVNGKEINPSATNVELGNRTTINFEEKYGKSLSSYNWVGAYYGDYTLDGKSNKQINTLTTSWKKVSAGFLSSYYEYNVVMKNASGETVYNETVSENENTVKEANITLVYAIKASTGGTGGSISTQQNVSHEKYVVDKKDGTYDLNLTVAGARGTETEPAKLDVLLIVDVSSSMKGSNISGAKNATRTLTDALKNRKDIDAKYSVVTFGETANTLVSWEQGTASNVVNQVNAITIKKNVGTNYQAGFREAKKQLNLARSDAQTVVIFLTDGWPTFYIGADGQTAGDGSSTYHQTLNASNQEASGMYVNQFYAIGVGDDMTTEQTIAGTSQGWWDSGETTTGAKILEAICKEVHTDKDKSEYYLSSADELSKLFDDIAGKTLELLCTNVEITDTLSDNVKLVESASGKPKDLVVTVKKGDKDGTLEVTGNNEVIFQDARIWAEYKDGKIMLHFPENYTLDPEYTYIVTANIEATETAYQHVREHGGTYPNTGEKGTGKTSEGKGGVFTNTKAEVAYTYNDVGTTESYNNPVIQLKPAKLIVKKTITGLTEEKINSALKNNLTFDITYTYPTGKQTTVTETKKLSDFTKNADDTYTYTYTYTSGDIWSMGATYEVTEKMFDVADYDCVATPDKATGSIPKYSTATATFTNTYTKATQDLTITKEILVDGNKYEGAEFNDAEYT
ncbi:MAG: vWA domain-containing protein, partial [Phascolarctobacterium sp.]